jgi:hypothetical protein
MKTRSLETAEITLTLETGDNVEQENLLSPMKEHIHEICN